MSRNEYDPNNPESAVHMFLDMVEQSQQTTQVMAEIAIQRLLMNPTFRFQVSALYSATDQHELASIQDYLADVAEDHDLSPDDIDGAMRRVRLDVER